jgi:ferredoxin--NADP+ reductase
VAIVGSGPSGYFSADALFKTHFHLEIDIFERLPTPFGLLRNGVAPDHQKMKSVASYFSKLHDTYPNTLQFFGNVEVGNDISILELTVHYDCIIFAYGSESDKKLNIEGEQLPGVFAAREFVGWYNGHPDFQSLNVDLSHHTAVIIGMGNIALDIARILGKTSQELACSDITQHAHNALSNSNIDTIKVFARRGPIQAAFTHLECDDLGRLDNCDIVLNPSDLALTEADKIECEASPKAQKNMAILKAHAHRPKSTYKKKIELCFNHSICDIQGSQNLKRVGLMKTKREGAPFEQSNIPTSDIHYIDCGLLFKSIGYHGLPISGLPVFDSESGTIPHQSGRLKYSDQGHGQYVVGWIKRGPIGVIGSNKSCAAETVSTLFSDVQEGRVSPCQMPSTDAVKLLLTKRGIRFVSFQEWQKIDVAETKRGNAVGKPREKFVSLEEMLHVL